jgi:hypothetical protein
LGRGHRTRLSGMAAALYLGAVFKIHKHAVLVDPKDSARRHLWQICNVDRYRIYSQTGV